MKWPLRTLAVAKMRPQRQTGRVGAGLGQLWSAARNAPARAAAESWAVLPDSITVNATSPRYPTNQLVQPDPLRTRPTCPYPGAPDRSAACAAPELTAPRMRPCTAAMAVGSSATPGPLGGSAPAMTCGACQLPESTAAATMAIASGLIRTF